MACLDKETATAYLRGDLDPHQAAVCAAHVASCDACRAIVENISALMDHARDALRELEDPSDAPDWSRIARVINRAIDREPPRRLGWPLGWSVRQWWLAPAPLIVSVMFVAVLGAFVYEQRYAERAASPAPASGPPPARPRALPVPESAPPAALPTPAVPVRTLSRAARLALEVRALSLLDGAGALLGEQVNVRGTPSGVRVEVTVDSDQRRLEIARALAPIVGAPGVEIRLQTFASEAKRQSESAARTTQSAAETQGQTAAETSAQAPPRMREVQVQRDQFAAAPLVREALRAGHPEKDAGAIEQETRVVAARATEQSQLALQHAWAVVRLSSRYAPETESTLPADARETWHAMIRLHAREVVAQATGLGETVAPVVSDLTPSGPTASSSETAPVDPRELPRVANRLVALAQAQDEIVRGAFSATAAAPTTAGIGSTAFRSTWQELMRLARQLAD
jgi:anti-sigma factor RsiW